GNPLSNRRLPPS
ncbi:variable surface lipoprotein, partial [Toxoplasma gondii CAST]